MDTAWLIILCSVPLIVTQRYEGDPCSLLDFTEDGKCVLFNECDYAKKLVLKNERPAHCGFKGLTPIVCCPPTKITLPPGNRSERECQSYQPEPGTFKTFVVHGTKSLSKEFPHMAAIGFGNEDNIQWLCGGSLISNQYILTAAHCLFSQEFGEAKWVRLGDLDIKNDTDDADPKDFSILEKIPHPYYSPPLQYNDIALLKINGPVQYNDYIKPICLYTRTMPLSNKATVTGWGKTEFAGQPSSHLLKADLMYINFEECKKNFNNNRRLPNGLRDESQLCAGDLEGKDTCQGDSGGPLQSDSIGVMTYPVLTGITSFGKACGIQGSSGVYTRVSHYIPWIEDIVWPN